MTDSGPIRIMIVDDHSIVRRGLAAYLKTVPDLVLVGEAGNGQQAVDRCEEIQPDVILMDLVMPELGGAEATRIIRQRWPEVQVIALTSFQEKELVQQAMRAGAISYLLKGVSGGELTDAVRAAAQGRSILAPEAVQALAQPEVTGTALGYDLTPREIEVLELLVKGLNNAQIAATLDISPATVKAHVSNILSKLGASSRAEAVSLAIQHNLVP
jgi:NarL family two-component system response regulator LiaR